MAQGFEQNQVSETNGSEGSRPCLIGARTYVNDTLPLSETVSEGESVLSYFNPLTVGEGMTASVDMVRLSLGMADADWLLGHADAFSTDSETWTGRGGVGSYHVLWKFPMGDSSVALGVGQRTGSGRVDMHKGFMEFNPNKVGEDERLDSLLSRMRGRVARVNTTRFDLAIDVDMPRNNLRMAKDRRKYQAFVDQTITEYLGSRNRGGFCKLYDKADESGMVGNLTRIELTCDGGWSASDVLAHWPAVYTWSVPQNSRTWVMVLSMALADIASRGGEIESLISRLPRSSRKTVRDSLQTSTVQLPETAIYHAFSEIDSWKARLV